ncbi:hypothetical protein BDV93DRAFT_554850 [Ceratobasidium sp. AG-I]|nr:hypothetical protein BDV93DRAFT_554850 [Ceratobasidium sp. AG-I]
MPEGKQEHSSALLKLPVEIFAQVAAFLMPDSMVGLARTNKSLRNLLMSRSAIQIWRVTIQNVEGLPPCPPSICEPYYSALLFSPYCSACGGPEPGDVDALLLIRFCHHCRIELLTRKKVLSAKTRESIVLASDRIVRGEKYSLESDLNAIKFRLLEFESQPKSARDAWLEDHLKELSRRHELAEQLYAYFETTRTKELLDSICGWLEGVPFLSEPVEYVPEEYEEPEAPEAYITPLKSDTEFVCALVQEVGQN